MAFGQSSGPVPPVDIARLSGLNGDGVAGSLWLTWASLSDYHTTVDELRASAAAVFAAVRSGAIRVRIAEALPLSGAEKAHRMLEARTVAGKLLLIP